MEVIIDGVKYMPVVGDVQVGWQPSDTAPEGLEVDVWVNVPESHPSMGFADGFRVPNAYRKDNRWFHRTEAGNEKELRSDYVLHWMSTPAAPRGLCDLDEFRLCLMTREDAFFTSGTADETSGEGWHRGTSGPPRYPLANRPEDWIVDDAGCRKPRWEILRVKFSFPEENVSLPEDLDQLKRLSADMINEQKAPWLVVFDQSVGTAATLSSLPAGSTYHEFVEFVRTHQGLVWVPLDGIDRAIVPARVSFSGDGNFPSSHHG